MRRSRWLASSPADTNTAANTMAMPITTVTTSNNSNLQNPERPVGTRRSPPDARCPAFAARPNSHRCGVNKSPPQRQPRAATGKPPAFRNPAAGRDAPLFVRAGGRALFALAVHSFAPRGAIFGLCLTAHYSRALRESRAAKSHSPRPVGPALALGDAGVGRIGVNLGERLCLRQLRIAPAFFSGQFVQLVEGVSSSSSSSRSARRARRRECLGPC